MAVTPNTVVHFLNVPLENNYKNQIYFADRSKQTSFMLTKRVNSVSGNPLTWSNLTYQRKDNIIRVPMHIDELVNANYVMYQNTGYTDRWFYAFITKMEYVNEGRTDVYIETDVWQTWFDKITLKESFVEREHVPVSDDIVGKHINEEGIQMGDYVCNLHTQAGYDDYPDGDFVIIIGVTQTPQGEKVAGRLYNGIYSGIKYYAFEHSQEGAEQIDEWILNYFSKEGGNEAIQCMFLAPKLLVEANEDHSVKSTYTPYNYNINDPATPDGIEGSAVNIEMTRNELDGYKPKNNKLLAYPYRYLLVSNNNGVAVPFQYEQFYKDHITSDEIKDRDYIKPAFTIRGCLTPGCSVRMTPMYYKGERLNEEEGINLGKFPALNWTSDYFTNWLTQNGVNIGVSIASDIGQMALGVAMAAASPVTGGVSAVMGASAITSGISGIANTMGEISRASKIPPQASGNINCGDVITASSKNDFHFYDMSIKRQYAEIIDNYFEIAGYKVNTVKVPQLNTRPHWNYIKTVAVNLDGKCPQEDLAKVRQMFDNGVTFWSNGNNVENYSLNNH